MQTLREADRVEKIHGESNIYNIEANQKLKELKTEIKEAILKMVE